MLYYKAYKPSTAEGYREDNHGQLTHIIKIGKAVYCKTAKKPKGARTSDMGKVRLTY